MFPWCDDTTTTTMRVSYVVVETEPPTNKRVFSFFCASPDRPPVTTPTTVTTYSSHKVCVYVCVCVCLPLYQIVRLCLARKNDIQEHKNGTQEVSHTNQFSKIVLYIQNPLRYTRNNEWSVPPVVLLVVLYLVVLALGGLCASSRSVRACRKTTSGHDYNDGGNVETTTVRLYYVFLLHFVMLLWFLVFVHGVTRVLSF